MIDGKNIYAHISELVYSCVGKESKLETEANMYSDRSISGFHRVVERSYEKETFVNHYLRDKACFDNEYEQRGYLMGVNATDTLYSTIVLNDMMKVASEMNISLEEIVKQGLLHIVMGASLENASSIVSGYGKCILINYVKNFATKRNYNIDDFNYNTIEKANKDKLGDESKSEPIKGLTHKQQILMLQKLGVFELEHIKTLNTTEIGKLIAYILNRDVKNTTEYYRNLNVPKNMVSKDAYFVMTTKNLRAVDEVLKELKLDEIVVTTKPTTPSK